MMAGCQFIGADQDPLKHWPIQYCGAQTITGKMYCADHYHRIYQKGSAPSGRRKEKEIDAEIEALKRQQEVDEMEAYDG